MAPEGGDNDDCWEVFGDDDDSESDCAGGEPQVESDEILVAAATNISLHLTKFFVHSDSSIPLQHRIVLHTNNILQEGSENGVHQEKLEQEFSSHTLRMIRERGIKLISEPSCADAAILFLSGTQDGSLDGVIQSIVPGGWLIISSLSLLDESEPNFCNILDDATWNIEDAKNLHKKNTDSNVFVQVMAVQKREGLINTLACLWKHPESSQNDQEALAYERFVISETTVGRSAYERSFPSYHDNSMTAFSIRKASEALKKYGFCVIRDIVPKADVRMWRDAVLADMDAAIDVLKKKHNVELLEPGRTAADPVSYRELAMREDLRVDLRLGPRMKQLRQQQKQRQEENNGESMNNLQNHTALLEIAISVMNPKGNHFRGNFGRWNFGGAGPDGTPQPMKIGDIGAVISFPGCGDQAIHADTPHLFEHINDLPPHYINLFLPTIDHSERASGQKEFNGESLVGGTAFLAETHKLDVCERVMDDNNRLEKLRRIIRPSLNMGDALLFDCRVLHFGLANNSHLSTSVNESAQHASRRSQCRPLLYMNLTHSWFSDPKNWDDRERLFSDIE